MNDSVAGRQSSLPTPKLENGFVLFFGALSAGLLGAVVGSYAIATDPATMATLATAAYLVGFALARTWIPDLLAHVVSLLIGTFVSLVVLEPRNLYEQVRTGAWRPILDRYDALLRGVLRSIDTGDKLDRDVAVIAIALSIWLVGYTAAWMLFRRGWLLWSVAVPGAVLLTALALARDRPAWPALLYLGLALAIAAGQTASTRTTFWSARGIQQPRSIGHRSMLFGSLIAALAVGVGLYYSFDLDDRFKDRAMQSGDQLANWVTNRLESPGAGKPVPKAPTGNYGAFSDQFKVGDGVPTGDVPVVVVQASGREYLAARRLNEYDGQGWSSTTGEAANDNIGPSPRIAFQSDQPMNIPRDQLQHRSQDEATITLLQPTGRLLFTIDQHFAASVPTLVRVGWETVDATYTIGQVDIANVPIDLRELFVLLQTATFTQPGSGSPPALISDQESAELRRIQDRLLNSYPVSMELSWSANGEVLVHIDGRLPVYSDVEAVYGSDDPDGSPYAVVGLAPQVTAAELASAGTSYPDYITRTYLQLTDTVTQETRDLANQIVVAAGAADPFDQAVAIQDFLRANFTYRIDAGPAPDGQDIVDYFLFQSKAGRCDHYSSAMAVMLRTLGVPARIVTGLAPVGYESEMGGYVYRGRNAHAWVEVYFPEYGWIQFEPTPSQSTVDLGGASDETISTPVAAPVASATVASASIEETPLATPTSTPVPAPATVDTESTNTRDVGSSLWRIGLGVGLAALATFAGYAFWRRRRAFSGMPVARANYGRLQRLGRYLGLQAAPELTPREYAAQFGNAKPKSAAGAMRVADAFTREQYATNLDAATIAQDSDSGWREARAGARDWRIWRRR